MGGTLANTIMDALEFLGGLNLSSIVAGVTGFIAGIVSSLSDAVNNQIQANGWSAGLIILLLIVIVLMLLFKNQLGSWAMSIKQVSTKLFFYALAAVIVIGLCYLAYTLLANRGIV